MTHFDLRPARPEDEEAVSELSSHIWEGEDYVPEVFAEWLEDHEGQFVVCYEGNVLVGFSKLTRIAPGEWWLEGLRVHPGHRGHGVARQLHRHMVEAARVLGTGVLRFATAATNVAVHKLAKETGFRQLNRYLAARYEVTGDESSVKHLARATEDDLPELRTWLHRSALYRDLGGLYEEHWQWQALEPRLSTLLREERIFRWYVPSKEPGGFLVVSQEEGQWLRLNYVDVRSKVLESAAREVQSLAAQRQLGKALAKLPARNSFRAAFSAGGWEIEPDFELVIFERNIGRF